MMQFTQIHDSKNEHDLKDITVTIPFEDLTLPQVLTVVEDFLRACGYTLPVESLVVERKGGKEND